MSLNIFAAGSRISSQQVNDNFSFVLGSIAPALQFSQNSATTSGLNWGYLGGALLDGSGTPHTFASGAVLLPASSVCNIEANPSTSAVTSRTDGQWTSGCVPLCIASTSATAITSALDVRAPLSASGAIILPATSAANGIVRLSVAPVSPASPIAAGDNDPRLSNARTPTAHKSSHATGGSDVLLPSDIGAAPLVSPALSGVPTAPTPLAGAGGNQIATVGSVQSAINGVLGAAPAALSTLAQIDTQLKSDESAAGALTSAISTETTNRQNGDAALQTQITANAGSITAETTARQNADAGIQSQVTTNTQNIASNAAAIGTALQSGNNLSEIPNTATARTNLGLKGAATRDVGTATGTVAAGDDARFAQIGNATKIQGIAVSGTAPQNGQIQAFNSGNNDIEWINPPTGGSGGSGGAPSGTAGGDLSGSFPNPSLAPVAGLTAGTYAYPSSVTVDAKGRVTGAVAGTALDDSTLSTQDVSGGSATKLRGVLAGIWTAITNLTTSVNGKIASSSVGAASGVASLDATGKVPAAQLPATSSGAFDFNSAWLYA